ncbi:MAG: carbohydrate kinase family protein [Candidatus Merdivicinus sp.]|jgi:fructokinase
MADVLTAGELLIDFTPVSIPGYPALLSPNPGGAPANVAVQLARLGISAGFIGKVGQDDFGRTLRRCLEENGVSIRNLILDEQFHTTLAFVQLDEHGDRSFTFYRNPGADTQLRQDEVDFEEVRQCRIFHFGSLSFTTEPSRSTILELIKAVKSMGKLISYDPNWRPLLWPSHQEGVEAMKMGLEYCDLLKISQEELELLTGCSNIWDGIRKVQEKGVILVVVTLGPDGCVFSCGGKTGHVPTYDTCVVDTTGSGDSFWGAFLSQLKQSECFDRNSLQGLSAAQLRQFCQFANAAGSVCASHAGGIPALPDEDHIRKCMEETAVLPPKQQFLSGCEKI